MSKQLELKSAPKVNHSDFMTITGEKFKCSLCQRKIDQIIHYRCVMCPDYLLCEGCEVNIYHKHPLLKIKSDAQSLAKCFYLGLEDLPAMQMARNAEKSKLLNLKLTQYLQD